jgi:RimJ/RimL family protein N-acetyltransferase
LVQISQEEIIKWRNLEFRRLESGDFRAFERAYNDSRESLMQFLDMGEFVTYQPSGVMNGFFQKNLRSKEIEMYGLFEEGALIGVGNFHTVSEFPTGCQITLWVTKDMQNQGYGKILLKLCTHEALDNKGFRFTLLQIDNANYSSKRMAISAGYELTDMSRHQPLGTLGTGLTCSFVAYDRTIEYLSWKYRIQPLDLTVHPGYKDENRHMLLDSQINSRYSYSTKLLNIRDFNLKFDGKQSTKFNTDKIEKKQTKGWVNPFLN